MKCTGFSSTVILSVAIQPPRPVTKGYISFLDNLNIIVICPLLLRLTFYDSIQQNATKSISQSLYFMLTPWYAKKRAKDPEGERPSYSLTCSGVK